MASKESKLREQGHLPRLPKRIDRSKQKKPADFALLKSAQAIEERRARVFELAYIRHFRPDVIAESLGVSIQTIYIDLKEIRATVATSIRSADIVETVGLSSAIYDKLFSYAMSELSKSKNPRTKNLFILTALKVHNSKNAFQFQVGLLPNKRGQIDLRVRTDVDAEVEDPEFAEAIKDPARRRRILQMVEHLANGAKGLTNEEPGMQTIDATVVEPAQPEQPESMFAGPPVDPSSNDAHPGRDFKLPSLSSDRD